MFSHKFFKKILITMLIFILLITGGIYFGDYELEKAHKRFVQVEAVNIFYAIEQLAVNHYVENHTWQEATKLLEQACTDPQIFKKLHQACVNKPRYISTIETLPLQYIFSFQERTRVKLKIHFTYSPARDKWECHGEGKDSTLLTSSCKYL